jgi:hypothetical protein
MRQFKKIRPSWVEPFHAAGRKDRRETSSSFLQSVCKRIYRVIVHATQVKHKYEVHPTSALDGGEWFTSRPVFAVGKEPRHPSNTKLRGPQRQSGRFEENKNLFPLPGFEAHNVQPET